MWGHSTWNWDWLDSPPWPERAGRLPLEASIASPSAPMRRKTANLANPWLADPRFAPTRRLSIHLLVRVVLR